MTAPTARRLLPLILGGTAIVVASGTLALAAFPWGWLRVPAERMLSDRLGRPVTIAAAERVDSFGFTPTVHLAGLRVAQASSSAGGDLARIADLTVRFPVAPLLRGALLPTMVDMSGLRLDLVRNATGRWNFGSDKPGGDEGGGDLPRIDTLRIRDGHLRLRDARRDLDLNATLAADRTDGLRITGTGSLQGGPVRVGARGGALDALDPDARYPFMLAIASPRVALSARGSMDHALDLGHFRARVVSRGDDLKSLDAILQAGLPATQHYDLTATVRRDAPRWVLTDLTGTLGRSDLAGTLTVDKRDGRSKLDAKIHANRFDFDDLASDEAKARGIARTRTEGRRVIPGTRVRLEKLGRTDGVLRFTATHLLMPPGSRFESLAATLTLDHRRLTVSPLRIGLTHGALTGRLVVDHRGRDPNVAIRLLMRGARIEDVLTRVSEASGPLDGRIALDGTGSTLRAAMARSNGTIGLVARDGQVARTLATLAAGDLLRGAGLAIGKDRGTVPIRCLVGRFQAKGGTLTPAPLLIDTPVMRADARGTVDLSTERLALAFTGRSKNPDLLQSAAPVRISGTLADPRLDVTPPDPPGRRRGLFAKIGTFLKTIRTRADEGRGTPAPDADCTRLERLALR